MRWVSDKTGRVVSHGEPSALVRLEFDGPAPPREVIRVIEERDPTVKGDTRKLGTTDAVSSHDASLGPDRASDCSGLSDRAVSRSPPPAARDGHTPARAVGKRKSPPLLVGGPVQVTFAETLGSDAQLGAPLVPGLAVSLGGHRTRSREIDPLVHVRALVPGDPAVRSPLRSRTRRDRSALRREPLSADSGMVEPPQHLRRCFGWTRGTD
jgi:hypothetical protein